MSNSSEFFSSEPMLQEEQNEALLRNVESTLKSELERLQILNERMHGEGCKYVSLPELRSLESQLSQGFLNVQDQLDKKRKELEEDERVLIKEGSEEEYILIEKNRDENITQQLVLSKNRKSLRWMAKDLRRCPDEETQQEHSHVALLQSIEYMKREIKTLELLNSRMSGKELDGLSYFELLILRREIQYGSLYMNRRVVDKNNYEKWCKENGCSGQTSMDDGTENHESYISSRHRLLRIYNVSEEHIESVYTKRFN